MRKFIQIRIVHSLADMGSMKEGLEKESIAVIGKERWVENQRKIEKFWNDVENEIDSLDLEYSKVRIYQDGLPAGGKLGLKIVNETADRGSRNYQIVRKLIEKGAAIEATESPELLRKEYEYIKSFVTAQTEKEKLEAKLQYDRIKDELLDERDTFIAQTVDATLKDNETGILFIGAAHNVVSKLPKDIEIKSLD